MMHLRVAIWSILLLVALSTAHFTINYPTPLGNDPNNEGTGPCGGFKYSATSNTTDFHVGGDAVALTTLHPQANILFRGTLDTSASGNWTQLFPVIGQFGLGALCEPSIPVPASWVGSIGLIQVIQNAVDGMLYQCAAVKFVSGSSPSVPSACTNSSAVSVSFTSDPNLPASQNSPSQSASTSSVATTSAPAAATTSAKPSIASGLARTTTPLLWMCLLLYFVLA